MKKLLLLVMICISICARSQEVASTGLSGGFRVAGSGEVDNYYDAPWYGLGQTSFPLPQSDGGPIVQLAGFYGLNIATASGEIVMLANGNVGVGTTSPNAKLEVSGTRSNTIGLNSAVSKVGGSDVFLYTGALAGSPNYGVWMQTMRISDALTFPLSLNPNGGNVGIGTNNPQAQLDLAGNMRISGTGASITFPDSTVQATAWNGTTCGGDYAESVDVAGDRKAYEPGDVLVINSDHEGGFLKSAEAYSTGVTGVYSTKPGLTGRRQLTSKNEDEVPMAMVGIVPTKVSAENGPIRPGDLLVSSSKPGYAMKGTDRSKMLGAVIGKALGHLDKGTGLIEVVILMQ